MVRNETWIQAWAPPLALVGIPLLVASLAVAFIPERVGALFSPHRSSGADPFTGEVPTASDIPASDAPEPVVRVAHQTTEPPPRSRGFSPILEREAPPEVATEIPPPAEAETRSADGRPTEVFAESARAAVESASVRSRPRAGSNSRTRRPAPAVPRDTLEDPLGVAGDEPTSAGEDAP